MKLNVLKYTSFIIIIYFILRFNFELTTLKQQYFQSQLTSCVGLAASAGH